MRHGTTARGEFITAGRIVKTGIRNFFRNSWLTVAATAVMVVALTIVMLAAVLNVTARNAIKELSSNLKVSVYLKEDVKEDDRKALERALTENQYSAGVQYISAEEAQKQFADDFKNDQKILEGFALVGGQTLPASFDVSVTNLAKMPDIKAVAEQEKFKGIVEDVSLGKTDVRKTIDRAASAQHFITVGSIIAATVFGLVSVMIIFNTIRMAIYTRREEIRIMKLIGATPNYIRGPFLVEASMYGIIAGLVASSATYLLVTTLGSKVATQPEFAETYTFFTQGSTAVLFVLGAVFAGVLIGIVSSTLAMERHLKLKNW